MGQQRQLMRQVLGRSHDLPPDWDALKDTYVLVSKPEEPPLYICIDETNEQSCSLTFDEKGRPYSPRIAKLEEDQANAVDFVTRYAVRSERKPIVSRFVEDIDGSLDMRRREETRRQTVIHYFLHAVTFGSMFLDTYLTSVIARVLIFKSSQTMRFSQIVASDIQDTSDSLVTAIATRAAIRYLKPFVWTAVQPLPDRWKRNTLGLVAVTTCMVETVLSPLRLLHDLSLLHMLPTYDLSAEPVTHSTLHLREEWISAICTLQTYSIARGFRSLSIAMLKLYAKRIDLALERPPSGRMTQIKKFAKNQYLAFKGATSAYTNVSLGRSWLGPREDCGAVMSYEDSLTLDPVIQDRNRSRNWMIVDINDMRNRTWELPFLAIAFRMAAQALVHQLHALRLSHVADYLESDLWPPRAMLIHSFSTSTLTKVGLGFALQTSSRCAAYLVTSLWGVHGSTSQLAWRHSSLAEQ